MNFDETVLMLGLEVNDMQRLAAAVCEGAGLRFCYDYGTDNCIEKANLIMDFEYDY